MVNLKSLKGWDLVIVLLVFALTGTTASFAPKFLMPLTGLEPGWLYWLVYFLLITPVYMVLLLGYAFIFGKFQYFYTMQKRIIQRIGGMFSSSKSSTKDNQNS